MTPEEICENFNARVHNGHDNWVDSGFSRISVSCPHHSHQCLYTIGDAERIALSYVQAEEIEKLKTQVAEYKLFKATSGTTGASAASISGAREISWALGDAVEALENLHYKCDISGRWGSCSIDSDSEHGIILRGQAAILKAKEMMRQK